MTLVIVLGARTPPGRLVSAAQRLARLAAERADAMAIETIDLAKAAIDIYDGRPLDAYSSATQNAVQAITCASAVIIASPVYKASFPGVLKNLLDLLPVEALQAKPVGMLVLGSSAHHYLAVENQLRQVLAWFGALVAPTAVYLTTKDFADGQLASDIGISDLRALVDTVLQLARSVHGRNLGPLPLAAKFAAHLAH